MTINEMTDIQLMQAYVIACKQYDQAYKDKKDIFDEMKKRCEAEIDKNRR